MLGAPYLRVQRHRQLVVEGQPLGPLHQLEDDVVADGAQLGVHLQLALHQLLGVAEAGHLLEGVALHQRPDHGRRLVERHLQITKTSTRKHYLQSYF